MGEVLKPLGPPSFSYRLFLAGYGVLLFLALPLVWHYFRRRADKDAAYGDHLEERQGKGETFDADVWVHAVSLGEMKSAVPLVKLLLTQGYRVITTHATPAGRRAAEEDFGLEIETGQLAVRYAPVDLQKYWGTFFESVKPKVGLVMEMEFWPGMIEAAANADVPLCLTNSQVPSKSLPRAKRLARWFGHPIARCAAVFAKSDRMSDRFRALGACNVSVMGETRFDIKPPPGQIVAGQGLRDNLGKRPTLVLASVVEGEEEIYIETIRPFIAEGANPLVIWVPRAPELFEATCERLKATGLTVVDRQSAFDADLNLTQPLDGIEVLVGNSLGEMFFYLMPANVVIVGGGFVEKGAHNVIEPLALGKPVITGPHTWTIEYPQVEAETAGVLSVCPSPEKLLDTISSALGQGDEAAKAFHGDNQGASERIFAVIQPLLEKSK